MRRASNILLILGSLIVSYGLVEIGLRILPIETLQRLSGEYFYDVDGSVYAYGVDKVNIALNPSAVSTIRTPEYATQIFINSLGYREREFRLRPDDGVLRILVLGDSVTFAKEVEQEERFTRLIETGPKRNFPNHRIEVLNLGIGSYSAGQSYLLLRDRAFDLQPDLVVFAYFSNDAMEWAYLADADGLPESYVVPVALWEETHPKPPAALEPARRPPDWVARWAAYSAVGDLVRVAWENQISDKVAGAPGYRLGDPRNDPFWPLREGFSASGSERWELHERVVERMAQLSLTRGTPFLFVAIPSGVQVNGFEWDTGRRLHGFSAGERVSGSPQRRLLSVVEQAGGTAIELTDLFRLKSSERHRIYFRYDGHLTVYGHTVAAEGILPALIEMISGSRKKVQSHGDR